jgi:uncharacterized protein HemY
MDFALFMERYGYKLILVGVFGGLFVALFGGIVRGLMVLGFTKSEAVLFIALLLIAVLIAAFVGHFMTRATGVQGRTRYFGLFWSKRK